MQSQHGKHEHCLHKSTWEGLGHQLRGVLNDFWKSNLKVLRKNSFLKPSDPLENPTDLRGGNWKKLVIPCVYVCSILLSSKLTQGNHQFQDSAGLLQHKQGRGRSSSVAAIQAIFGLFCFRQTQKTFLPACCPLKLSNPLVYPHNRHSFWFKLEKNPWKLLRFPIQNEQH